MPDIAQASPPGPPRCWVCQMPLSPLEARAGFLCQRAHCQTRYALLQRQRRICVVCGRSLTVAEWPNQSCATPACQRAAITPVARRVQARNEAHSAALIAQEIALAAQLRQRVMRTFTPEDAAHFQQVIIPACTARLTPLPQRRWRAFRDHLNRLISAAHALPRLRMPEPEFTATTPTPPDRLQTVLAQACACCRGRCCTGGGNQAYLDVATVQRYRTLHPEQRPRHILAAYLDRIGPRSYQDSCIYHQARGCGLTRDMRADLCNRHFCTALQHFQTQQPPGAPVRGLFIAADDGALHRAVRIDAGQVTPIPL